MVDPYTVSNLVRPFVIDPQLGATAGAISVGNARNLLTRWQRLEYTCQVGVDRAAGEVLNSIMVVPGAAGAWRKSAVLAVGGYSTDTLAEDADLCLTLQHAGYRVAQVDEALCYTEAPENFKDLMKQRKRWLLGQFQCLWKHRGMMLNPKHGWLGMFYLPITLFGIAVPILTQPFLWLTMTLATYNHGFSPLLPPFMIFAAVQAIIAVVAIALMKRGPATLIGMGFDLVAYPPIRAYLLYRTTYSVLSGRLMGWNKLARTGNVTAPESALVHEVEMVYANN